MKKSIEERAEFYERQEINRANALGWCNQPSPSASYIKGATEQKAIDDEEQGKELLYAVHKTAERTKREMIDKAKRWAGIKTIISLIILIQHSI